MSSREPQVPVTTTTMSTPPPQDTVNTTGFDVVFAGLICFAKKPQPVALFANGVTPADPTVNPHHPYLIIDPDGKTKEIGWQDVDKDLKSLGIYQLPRCVVEISRATTTISGKLEASQHNQNTPLLKDVDPKIEINPMTADAVVRVNLANGTLQALRHPDPPDPQHPDDVAIISRLRVENDSNPIIVDIWEGTDITRSLELKANTDIGLVNIGFPIDVTKTGDHFSIYGALTTSGKITGHPTASKNVTVIHSGYMLFKLNLPIVDGLAMCGTSGCCPP